MRFIDTIKQLFLQAKQQQKNNSASTVLLQHISQQLDSMSENIETIITDVASGRYKPPDSVYEYTILDRQGETLQTEWHDLDYVDLSDIQKTSGYKKLAAKADTLGLKLKLIEESCMEYDDEDRNYYIVRFSGWS